MSSQRSAVVCNAAALRGASRRISQVYDEILAPSGLRGTQFSMLYRIDKAGALPLNVLASELAMDRSTLGHNLKPLERDGYVVFGVDANDRRVRTIALTPLGKKKLAEARPLWARAHNRFEQTFGAKRAANLRALLAELASDDFLQSFVET